MANKHVERSLNSLLTEKREKGQAIIQWFSYETCEDYTHMTTATFLM